MVSILGISSVFISTCVYSMCWPSGNISVTHTTSWPIKRILNKLMKLSSFLNPHEIQETYF